MGAFNDGLGAALAAALDLGGPGRVRRRADATLRAIHGRVRAVPYLGSRYACPCCGGSFRAFLPHGVVPRPNAECPRCQSLERHRLLWLYLLRETNLLATRHRVLHVAPEYPLQRALSKMPNLDYVSADLQSRQAMVKLDIQDIPYRDRSFDVILCNHVLEHVPDDRRAIREFARVLSPDGWAILLAPIEPGREVTFEDPTVVDPDERERVFGQRDHVRIYGRDYVERLREAGFVVAQVPFASTLDPALITRHGLARVEDLFVCTKAS